MWRQLRSVIPERTRRADSRRNQLPQAGTAFGRRRAAVLRQLGQDRQLPSGGDRRAVDRARAWMLGAALYLPEAWLTPEARQRAQIPRTVRFQEKWRLALTLLRQIRASGFQLTAVVGDAEFGDNATLRRTLHRAKLPYALGVSSDLKVFLRYPTPGDARAVDRHRAARAPAACWRQASRRSRSPPWSPRNRPARGGGSAGATATMPPWRAAFWRCA